VAWARGRESAALDLSLFEDRNYRLANLATLIFGAAFGMMFVSFFLFMTGVWGYSQSAAGLAVTPGPLTVIPVAVLAGRLAARMGHRPLLVSGGVLYTVSSLWYWLRISARPEYLTTWLPGQLMSGGAVELCFPPSRVLPFSAFLRRASESAVRSTTPFGSWVPLSEWRWPLRLRVREGQSLPSRPSDLSI
jgi:MFS family permease